MTRPPIASHRRLRQGGGLLVALRRARRLARAGLFTFLTTFVAAPCLHNLDHRADHSHDGVGHVISGDLASGARTADEGHTHGGHTHTHGARAGHGHAQLHRTPEPAAPPQAAARAPAVDRTEPPRARPRATAPHAAAPAAPGAPPLAAAPGAAASGLRRHAAAPGTAASGLRRLAAAPGFISDRPVTLESPYPPSPSPFHGDGALAHFGLAVLASSIFLLPPPASRLSHEVVRAPATRVRPAAPVGLPDARGPPAA